MGLDFGIYWFKKSDGSVKNQFEKWDYKTWEAHELAYARKGWELVHDLECATDGDCSTRLTLDVWMNLAEKLAIIGPYLYQINDAYKTLDEAEFNYETINEFPEEVKLIVKYINWFETNFDEYPQLGYDFSVGYMINFWEASDKIIEYLENPEYEVWMFASY